jgi:hypothetical protein
MKKFLFSLLVLSFQFTKAQYTLTSSSSPQVGDNNSSVSIYTTGLVVPTSGSGQTWNYSAINENTTSITTSTFVALSSVPNSSLYSNATIAETFDNTNYDVYDNSAGADYLGTSVATISNCIVFSDPIKYMSYPFSYGSSYTDNFLLSNSMYVSSGTVVVAGDGTGTLAIPNFTFNNVLKVSQSYTQTLAVGNATYTYVGLNNYFYCNLSKFPLLTINTSTQTGGGAPTVIDLNGSVNKNFTVVGLNKINETNDFTLYPNPSNGLFEIQFENTVAHFVVLVTDIYGREIKREEHTDFSKHNTHINLKDAVPGIYYVKVKSSDGETTRKIIIE